MEKNPFAILFFQFDKNYSGNGQNKWPNPSSVQQNWREVVIFKQKHFNVQTSKQSNIKALKQQLSKIHTVKI